MSISHELASIIENVTKSSQISVVSVDDGIRVYIIDYSRRGCSYRTMFTAFYDLQRFAKDISVVENGGEPLPLERLSRPVLEAHLARLTLGREEHCTRVPSTHTVERRRRVVKAFVRWLFAEDYIQCDPTKKLSSIAVRKRYPSVWEVDDVERFLNTFEIGSLVGHRDYSMALLALSSRLRAGEIALLRPSDVDLKSRTISVSEKGKTGARTAVMTVEAAREISRWLSRRKSELGLNASTPLFPPMGHGSKVDHSRPMRANSISTIIARHAKEAGIVDVKRGAHALRHTAATHLARRGASAFEIQQFLGHSNIEMSQRYVEMSNVSVQRRVQRDGVLSQVAQHKNDEKIHYKNKALNRILSSR